MGEKSEKGRDGVLVQIVTKETGVEKGFIHDRNFVIYIISVHLKREGETTEEKKEGESEGEDDQKLVKLILIRVRFSELVTLRDSLAKRYPDVPSLGKGALGGFSLFSFSLFSFSLSRLSLSFLSLSIL